MAQKRQSRTDSGLGVQVKVFKTFQVVPSPLGIGRVWGLQGYLAHEKTPTLLGAPQGP